MTSVSANVQTVCDKSTVMQLNVEDIDQVTSEGTDTIFTLNASHNTCILCKTQFNTESQLFQHRVKHDRCFHCEELFSCQKELVIHQSLHDDENCLCLFCGDKLDDQGSLKTHLSRHRKSYETYDCNQCERKLLSMAELEIHKRRHSTVEHETVNISVAVKRKNEEDSVPHSHIPDVVEKKVKNTKNDKFIYRVSKDGLQLIDNGVINTASNTEVGNEPDVQSNIDIPQVGEFVHYEVSDETSDSKEQNCIYVIDNENVQIVNLDSAALSDVNIAGYYVNEDGILIQQVDSEEYNKTHTKVVLSTVDGTEIINYRDVGENDNPFKCGYCSQPYSDSMELFVHMTQEHYEKLDTSRH